MRGKNLGVGKPCGTCNRTILAGHHIRHAQGTFHHRDCQIAAAIAYQRSVSGSRQPAAHDNRITGIPTVIASSTGHNDNPNIAARTIANGRKKPRTLDEAGPGQTGGGHDR